MILGKRNSKKNRGRTDVSRSGKSDRIPPLAARASLYIGHDQKLFQASIDELQTILQEYNLLSEKSGVFDENTESAVKEFQRLNGLQVDGWVGSLTWAALLYPTLSRHKQSSPENEHYVRELQNLLRQERLKVQITGCFDKKTERALRKFQRRYYLRADGVCGPQTWNALMGQKFDWDINSPCEFLPFPIEQPLIILSILVGMYFGPFNLGLELPFINALVTSYALTCCVQPVLSPLFADYLNRLDRPLLKYAPYVLTGFIWRQVFNVIIQSLLGQL